VNHKIGEFKVFLLCSTFIRLASGALLVTLTWNILNQNNISYLPLAVAIFSSLLPAFLAPSIIRRLSVSFNGRKMSSLFLLALVPLTMLAGVSRYNTMGLLIINLLVWLIFLLLEASLDMWFTQLQRHLPESQVRRLSGATTAGSQTALMVGPLLAAMLEPLLGNLALAALLAAVFLLVSWCCNQSSGDLIVLKHNAKNKIGQKLPLMLLIPMVLVWPTLGAFNFMLPIYVTHQGWTMLELGMLDACFGLGMAAAGIMVTAGFTGTRLFGFLLVLLAVSTGATITWLIIPQTFLLSCLCLTLLGLAFGGARIQIRCTIAQCFDEVSVGQHISRANAFGTPVLLLVLMVQLSAISKAWLLPFLMVILSISLLIQLIPKRFQPKDVAS
jgi:hypothetical protein